MQGDFSATWGPTSPAKTILDRFSKVLEYQILWKSVQWESRSSRRTDRHDKDISRMSRVCERA